MNLYKLCSISDNLSCQLKYVLLCFILVKHTYNWWERVICSIICEILGELLSLIQVTGLSKVHCYVGLKVCMQCVSSGDLLTCSRLLEACEACCLQCILLAHNMWWAVVAVSVTEVAIILCSADEETWIDGNKNGEACRKIHFNVHAHSTVIVVNTR